MKLLPIEKKEIAVWQPEDVGRFLDTASQHRLGSLFEVAIFTGVRRGELLALKRSDVDLANRTLTVRSNRTQAGKNNVENAPKTESWPPHHRAIRCRLRRPRVVEARPGC